MSGLDTHIIGRRIAVATMIQVLVIAIVMALIQIIPSIVDWIHAIGFTIDGWLGMVLPVSVVDILIAVLATEAVVGLAFLFTAHSQLLKWTTGIDRLHQATGTLASGRLPEPMVPTGNVTMDHLLTDFNDMAAQLHCERYAALQANEQLETCIEHRTCQWQAATRRAEQASAAKSEFLTTLTHEIRTPLTGVIGALELLESRRMDAMQRRIVRTGRLAGKALLNLINDVLDFSTIEIGELKLAAYHFILEEVIEEAITIVGPLALSKRLDLTMQIEGDVRSACIGDAARLRQILINLLSNAVRFTDRGSVTVVVSNQSDTADTLRFEVRDTGIGISEEAKKRVFTAFEKAGNDVTGQRGGTGLGLTVCRHLVQLMGGQIGIESTVGCGTTFWFTIQIKTAESKTSIPPATVKPRRILLVDVTKAVRKMAEAVLTQRGHVVTVIEGETQITNDRFDCVIFGSYLGERRMQMHVDRIHSLVWNKDKKPSILQLFRDDLNGDPIDSEKSDGQIQRLYLPLLPSQLLAVIETGALAEDISRDQSATDDVSLRGVSVLVAEDNATNRFVIKNMLKRLGVQTMLVENGRAAVGAAQSQRFDLILMDYRMPKMDGIAATRIIRSLESVGTIAGPTPIIALTANVVHQQRNEFTEAGMDGVLMKPVELEALRQMIVQYAKPPCNDAASTPACPMNQDAHRHLIDFKQLRDTFSNRDEDVEEAVNVLHKEFASFKQALLAVSQGDIGAIEAACLGHKIAGCALQLHNETLEQAARAFESSVATNRLVTASLLAQMVDDCIQQFASYSPSHRAHVPLKLTNGTS